MQTIHFSPTALPGLGRKYRRDDGMVVRPAKVFECGDYPDKGFSLTEQEADEAIRAFAPVHNNVEHRPSVFDRLLGTTEGLFRRGREVFANLVIPEGVDALLGDAPIPLSAEWTADPKHDRGTALTVNPRVLSAAAHAFTGTPEFKTFAAEHPSEAAELVNEARKAPNPATPMNPQQIKDAAWTSFSADPKNAGVTREQFDVAFANPVPKADTTKSEPTDADRRIEALERQNAEFARQNAVRDDAEAAKNFYADQLDPQKNKDGSRVSPAEKDLILAAFSAARAADRANTTNFTANAEGSHEKAFRDAIAARPVVFRMGGNVLPSQDGIDVTKFSDEPTGDEAWKNFSVAAHLGLKEKK